MVCKYRMQNEKNLKLQHIVPLIALPIERIYWNVKMVETRECVQTLRQFPRFSIYNRNQLPVVVACQLARLLPRSNARQSSHVSCLPWNMLTRLHASPGIIKIRNHEKMAVANGGSLDLFVSFFFNLDLARVEKFIRLKTKFFSHFILKLITHSFLINF